MVIRNLTLMLVLTAVVASGSLASADQIYVLGGGHSSINNAINNLNSIGHAVTNSNTPLTDYSAFDQVWDLRYSSDLTAAERSAFAGFLAVGGQMYLTGENGAFDSNRNNDINVFLNEIGAGAVGLASNTSNFENQTITSAGQLVNDPNVFNSVSTYFARRVVAPGTGFLVSESPANPGTGSLVGWDFGDLPNHPNARMLIGYDIELFDNGVAWTENISSYLGGNSIPEPGSLAICMLSAAGVSFIRRRQGKKLG
jgi:hypothetical protein